MNFSQFLNLPTKPNTTSDSCLNLLKSLYLSTFSILITLKRPGIVINNPQIYFLLYRDI